MIFCVTSGFGWDTVYSWNVDEFMSIYRSLQRQKARDTMSSLATLQQAFGGDKKSIKEFVKHTTVWLPSEERSGEGSTDDFLDVIKKGLNLKK